MRHTIRLTRSRDGQQAACVVGTAVAQAKSWSFVAQTVFIYLSGQLQQHQLLCYYYCRLAVLASVGVYWPMIDVCVAWLAAQLNSCLVLPINIRSAAVARLLLPMLLATIIYVRLRCEYCMSWVWLLLRCGRHLWAHSCVAWYLYIIYIYFCCVSACVWHNVISNNDSLSDWISFGFNLSNDAF